MRLILLFACIIPVLADPTEETKIGLGTGVAVCLFIICFIIGCYFCPDQMAAGICGAAAGGATASITGGNREAAMAAGATAAVLSQSHQRSDSSLPISVIVVGTVSGTIAGGSVSDSVLASAAGAATMCNKR